MSFGNFRNKQNEQVEEQRPRLQCAAHGCHLAGSISDGPGGNGFCAYHFGAPADIWGRITETMTREHGPLLSEILTGRRFHARMSTQRPSDMLGDAWARLQPHGYDLDPANCVKGKNGRRPVSDYRQWCVCCEALMGQFIGPLLGHTSSVTPAKRQSFAGHVAEALEQLEAA